MIGYHCKLTIGEVLESIQFFTLFDMTWLLVTGWILEEFNCLPGGLI